MGSWNGTCGLSNLPIRSNDKVKMVFLEKSLWLDDSSKGAGFCYPDRLYSPLSLPLSGVYNDYGSIEDIQDIDNIMYNYVKELAKSKGLEDSFESFEELVQNICYGNVENFTLVLFHKDLYDTLVETIRKSEYNSYEGTGFYGDLFQKFVDSYLKTNILDNIFERDNEFKIKYLPRNIRQEYVRTKFIPIGNEMVNFLLFQEAMDLSRKFWSPQCGAGSQNIDYTVSSIVAKFAIEQELKDLAERDY